MVRQASTLAPAKELEGLVAALRKEYGARVGGAAPATAAALKEVKHLAHGADTQFAPPPPPAPQQQRLRLLLLSIDRLDFNGPLSAPHAACRMPSELDAPPFTSRSACSEPAPSLLCSASALSADQLAPPRPRRLLCSRVARPPCHATLETDTRHAETEGAKVKAPPEAVRMAISMVHQPAAEGGGGGGGGGGRPKASSIGAKASMFGGGGGKLAGSACGRRRTVGMAGEARAQAHAQARCRGTGCLSAWAAALCRSLTPCSDPPTTSTSNPCCRGARLSPIPGGRGGRRPRCPRKAHRREGFVGGAHQDGQGAAVARDVAGAAAAVRHAAYTPWRSTPRPSALAEQIGLTTLARAGGSCRPLCCYSHAVVCARPVPAQGRGGGAGAAAVRGARQRQEGRRAAHRLGGAAGRRHGRGAHGRSKSPCLLLVGSATSARPAAIHQLRAASSEGLGAWAVPS